MIVTSYLPRAQDYSRIGSVCVRVTQVAALEGRTFEKAMKVLLETTMIICGNRKC